MDNSVLLVTETAAESKPLTDEEQEVLDRLKEHIGPDGQKELEYEALLRFVRGYAFEAKTGGKDKWIQVACAEADKTIAWRKSVDAGTLLSRKLPQWDVFASSWVSAVYGLDNQGHPILVERVQDIKIDRLLSMFKVEDLALYQARNMEHLQALKAQVSTKLSRTIYKHCYILDMTGLSTKVYSARAHVQAIFHVAQYYYPETLFRMFVINAPFVFRAVWSMVSPLIHPITREKIKVLGNKFIQELATFGIDASQLPKSIGGTYSASGVVGPDGGSGSPRAPSPREESGAVPEEEAAPFEGTLEGAENGEAPKLE